MRAQFVLSEVGIGLRRNLTMQVALVVTVFVSLVLLGGALLLSSQISTMKGYWYDKVEVSVFLCGADSEATTCAGGAVTEAQREEIRDTLESLPQVETVFYESQAQAFERFQEQFKNNPDLVNNVTEEFLPESFRVKLEDPEQYALVASAVEGTPGVESVQDQNEILDKLFNMMNYLRFIVLFIAAFMAFAAILLIANAVQVAAFSRRRETSIMRLVGASNFFIRLPFILEAVIAALLGATLAIGAIFIAYSTIKDWMQSVTLFADTGLIGWDAVWATVPVLLISAALVSGLAALLTLQRYLRV